MFDVKRHPLNYYENDVLAYEQEPIEEGKIIFYGSSGFTRWKAKWGNTPLEEAIPGKNGEKMCINHALGGSTTEELLYYYPRLVRAWKPKALVLTAYANDWGFGYNVPEMMMLVSRILEYARTDMPGIKLFITDRRPNAKNVNTQDHVAHEDRAWDRGAWLNTWNEMNDALRAYCAVHPDTTLIEYHKFDWMFEEGCTGDLTRVRPELLVEDKVHFTKEAYAMLAEEYKKILADLL